MSLPRLDGRDDLQATLRPLTTQQTIPARRVLDGLPPLRSGLSKFDSPTLWHTYLQATPQTSWFQQLGNTDAPSCQPFNDQRSWCHGQAT